MFSTELCVFRKSSLLNHEPQELNHLRHDNIPTKKGKVPCKVFVLFKSKSKCGSICSHQDLLLPENTCHSFFFFPSFFFPLLKLVCLSCCTLLEWAITVTKILSHPVSHRTNILFFVCTIKYSLSEIFAEKQSTDACVSCFANKQDNLTKYSRLLAALSWFRG